MIVVSDTTPLITLMKAKKLDILHHMFGEVMIPEAVFSEVTGNDAFREEANTIRNSNYIKVVRVRDSSQVSFLQRATGLDLGESEAIIYADEVMGLVRNVTPKRGLLVKSIMNFLQCGFYPPNYLSFTL